jgi:hypothetical protein
MDSCIVTVKTDIEELEVKLCIMESSENFHSENPRYKRYINEKKFLRDLFPRLMAVAG